jgi:type III secretion protein V
MVVSAAVRRYAGSFWTVDSTDAALFLLRDTFEPLIHAVELRFDHRLLTRVLRSLLDEEISVRNLTVILESMLAIDSVSTLDDRTLIAFPPAAGNMALSRRAASVAQLQVNDWVTCVRIRLARYLSHKYTRGQSTLIVYLLDPKVEAELETESGRSPGGTDQGPNLHTPQGYLRLFRAIDAEIARLPAHSAKPVILTGQSVRYTLRDLISKDFPNVTVLSYQELSPEMNIQPIARITWP